MNPIVTIPHYSMLEDPCKCNLNEKEKPSISLCLAICTMSEKYRSSLSTNGHGQWTRSEEHAHPFLLALHIRVAVLHRTQEHLRRLALAAAVFCDLIESNAGDLVARVTVLEASVAICLQGKLSARAFVFL
jgi:hypothetical protein